MGDLGCTVVEFDPPADDPLGADREQPREIVALEVEVSQGQPPGRVGADHPVGPRTVAGLVRLDPHRDRHDLVWLQVLDRRRGAAIDDAARQVPQQVDDERTGKALEELCELLADAVESPGARRLMTRLLQDPELQQLLRQAVATQAAGFAEEVVVDVRRRTERLDGRAEGLVWRLLRKHPRTIRVPFGGVATRGLGLVVDTLLVHLVFLAAAALIELVASLAGGAPNWLEATIVGIGFVVVSVAYFVAFWSTVGQTPGMHLAGVRVRGPDGKPPGVIRSVVRWIGLVLAIILLFLGFVPALIDNRRRALQDFLAGTTVVYAGDAEPATP